MNDSLNGLDRYIEQALHEFNVPGAAVAIVCNQEVLRVAGYGVREMGRSERVDEHTLFQIGSTTKAFTATALGVLVDDGKLRWDDPVVLHVPDFQLHDPWLTRQVAIRDLLTHATGFVDSIAHAVEVLHPDEAVRRMRCRTTFAPFRGSYHYSNLMYGVAGKVIAGACGSTWGHFVRSRILRPLGMNRSGTSATEYWDSQYLAPTLFGTAPAGTVGIANAREPNLAMPHFHRDGGACVLPWQSYDSVAAAGSVVSSASDLSNWLLLHLNRGEVSGQRLLSRETMMELHRGQNLHDRSGFPFEAEAGAHAMGWRREQYRGDTHLSHGGLILGFPAHISFLPERAIGVAVLANAQHATFEMCEQNDDPMALHKSIALWVFDRLTGGPTMDWRAQFRDRRDQAQRKWKAREQALQDSRLLRATPTLPLEAYVGEYADRSGRYGPVQIALEGECLLLRFMGPGAFCADLDHWHQDLFRLAPRGAPWIHSFVSFSIAPDAKPERLQLFEETFVRTV